MPHSPFFPGLPKLAFIMFGFRGGGLRIADITMSHEGQERVTLFLWKSWCHQNTLTVVETPENPPCGRIKLTRHWCCFPNSRHPEMNVLMRDVDAVLIDTGPRWSAWRNVVVLCIRPTGEQVVLPFRTDGAVYEWFYKYNSCKLFFFVFDFNVELAPSFYSSHVLKICVASDTQCIKSHLHEMDRIRDAVARAHV